MKNDPFAAAYNAITNASRLDVTRAEIEALLKTGDGTPHHVRALFEGCPMETLERLAMECGLPPAGLRAALRVARAKHAAANADFLEEENSSAGDGHFARPDQASPLSEATTHVDAVMDAAEQNLFLRKQTDA